MIFVYKRFLILIIDCRVHLHIILKTTMFITKKKDELFFGRTIENYVLVGQNVCLVFILVGQI